jgi:hypothetical protein
VDCSFDPAGQTDGLVRCLLQQPDGKVLVGGGFGRLLGQRRPALARLLANGSNRCQLRRRHRAGYKYRRLRDGVAG